ncbi:MAG: GGDEF domain-containing protein [Oscillospiraceae bacterium]|nr:GGDEF domain-containing protein [Oscillospiraceae bacterium]
MDLFEKEQNVLNNATAHLEEVKSGGIAVDGAVFAGLVKEYGRLLKQLRRMTKISDRATDNLNTSKLDLVDKVHYDALTGMYNRRFMEESIKRIIKSLARSGGCLSILMMDVDNFKKYNDTYGHAAGDECLKSLGEALKKSIMRPDDFVARYGGEEFIAVLPGAAEADAAIVAERVLVNVRELKIPHEKNENIGHVTISVGGTTVTEISPDHKTEDYTTRADEALYSSKHNGRNRYTFIKY